MEKYGGVEVLVLGIKKEVSSQLHAPVALSPGKLPRYPLIGGFVGPRVEEFLALSGKYCIVACRPLIGNGHEISNYTSAVTK
jgi:hypothetical protein